MYTPIYIPYMEYVIKVLLRFGFVQFLSFFRSGSPLPPEFNVGTLVPEKNTTRPEDPNFEFRG